MIEEKRYKGKKSKPGWYLKVNGKQTRYYGRHLSAKQRRNILHNLRMHDKGFGQVNSKTYRSQESEDQIKEVTEKEFCYEVTDIIRDPETQVFKKEPVKEREYIPKDENISGKDEEALGQVL